ncbi:MAG TPA: MoaD/ThiS family protein [Bacillota bacterium]|nr:MoaD/ThiS family protein [Bacillota bacterium]
MTSNLRTDIANTVEIRAFSFLKPVFDERGWTSPYYFPLDKPCTPRELARVLELPMDKIEAVFVNGLIQPLDEGQIKAGDRIAFVPPGTPGPYRVFLGMVNPGGEQEEQ